MDTSPTMRWTAALLAGGCWGAAPPVAMGAPLVLCGAVCAAAAIEGKPRDDLPRAVIAALVASGLALAWIPGAWNRYAGAGGWAAFAALAIAECAGIVLALGLWSGGMSRGIPAPAAAALAAAAAETAAAWLQPVPASPVLLLGGTPAFLGPAALGGRPLMAALLFGGGALAWRSLPWTGALLAAWIASSLAVPTGGIPLPVTVVETGTGAFAGRRTSDFEARAEWLGGLRPEGIALAPEGAWHGDDVDLAGDWVIGATGSANSLLLVRDGAVVDRFDKQRLVPVLERRLTTGTGPRSLGDDLGPLICYEVLFPSAIAEAAAHCPALLVAASNDAWLGPRGAALQLAGTRLAAVTSGRWTVRPTTTGPSAVIDPRGRVAWSTRWRDGDTHPGPVVAEVTVQARRPAIAGASVAPWISLASALMLLGWRRR